MGILRSSTFLSAIAGSVFFILAEEHLGKRKVYLSGLFLISLGNLMMFLSQSMAGAVAGQILLGFSALPLIRFTVALISDITEPSLSAKFLSIMQGYHAI